MKTYLIAIVSVVQVLMLSASGIAQITVDLNNVSIDFPENNNTTIEYSIYDSGDISIVIPAIFLSDFLLYFIVAGYAYMIFWVLFKQNWTHRIIQQKTAKISKIWFELRYSLSTILIYSVIGVSIVMLKHYGYTKIYNDIAERGWLYFVFSIGFMIIMHDAYYYWMHRFMHHPKVFKHVHLVHHRSTSPSPWAAYCFHPFEALIDGAIYPLIVFTMPINKIALFVFLVYMILRIVMGHLGIEILPKWFLKIPILNLHTTTTHHDLHHKHFDTNYALYFIWWDKWFGTVNSKYVKTFEEVTSREKINSLTNDNSIVSV